MAEAGTKDAAGGGGGQPWPPWPASSSPSLMCKLLVVVSVSVTYLLVYRVYVLESRVDRLEQQLAKIAAAAAAENAPDAGAWPGATAAPAEDEGPFSRRRRRKRNTPPECGCPAGESN